MSIPLSKSYGQATAAGGRGSYRANRQILPEQAHFSTHNTAEEPRIEVIFRLMAIGSLVP